MKLVGPRKEFCLNLAHHLQCPFVEMDRRVFPDGEINPRILKAPKEAVLVNTLSSSDFDPNRYLMEYIFSIKNLKERGTEKIALAMPYLPYSRQDRVFREGESFTSKYVLEIFRDLGIRDVVAVTFHLHRQRSVNLVKEVSLHDVSGVDALRDHMKTCVKTDELESPLFVAPDEEAEKWARQMAESFEADVAVLEKRRNIITGAIEIHGEIPECRNVIIVDDMISSGGTVLRAIEICKKFKAKRILVCAVHGIFSKSIAWNVDIITTNTIENPYAQADVTPYMAKVLLKLLDF